MADLSQKATTNSAVKCSCPGVAFSRSWPSCFPQLSASDFLCLISMVILMMMTSKFPRHLEEEEGRSESWEEPSHGRAHNQWRPLLIKGPRWYWSWLSQQPNLLRSLAGMCGAAFFSAGRGGAAPPPFWMSVVNFFERLSKKCVNVCCDKIRQNNG